MDAGIPEELITPLRSLAGQLNWAASVSRPDVAYQACQTSSSISSATMKDIHTANKAIKYLKNNPVSIQFPRLDLSNIFLEAYADAAFGNLPSGSSQGGYLIFVTDGKRHVPVSWSSHKLKRVARSTLTAETIALNDAIDMAIYFSTMLTEVLNHKQKMKIICYTDSNSLYEAAHTTNVVKDYSPE